MTYAWFLLLFLVTPIILLTLLILRGHLQAQTRGAKSLSLGRSPVLMVAALIFVAILYTAPWDNHLIAHKVWWYNPALISGITLGWIPLEELVFFPLQTLAVGLWFLWLIPRIGPPDIIVSSDGSGAHGGAQPDGDNPDDGNSRIVRLLTVVVCGGLWVVALAALLLRWRPGTYLGWELVWALPPIILQLSLGADILWRYRRLLGATLIPLILYLSAVDALAIHEGIWTIDPRQSLSILLGGQLPLEELVFFTLTSVLITFGLVLGLSVEARRRFQGYQARLTHALDIGGQAAEVHEAKGDSD